MLQKEGSDISGRRNGNGRCTKESRDAYMETNRASQIKVRYIDLFCGIGGFRLAAQNAAKLLGVEPECVFSSDIDTSCQDAYEANFGERPVGDITKVNAEEVPTHDLLLAGFPCQPFSIIGNRKGFEDTRGTLFFDMNRIVRTSHN